MRILLLAVIACAMRASETSIAVPRVTRPPLLADFLEGHAREAEVTIRSFVQREPLDGHAPAHKTTVYISSTAEELYVAFVCEQDPAAIRSHLSKRESITGDDVVGVALDTFHDRRHAYLFYSNPHGIQADGFATEGQQDDYKFDTLWRSEGRITSDGYVVLFSIPFRSIRSGPTRTWGIALTRYSPAESEVSTYPHLSSRIDSYVPQFADLYGVHDVPRCTDIQLVPYLFGETTAGPSGNRRELRGGLDSRVRFANGLVLDTTVNPDFSQVE